jgi:hypothetical protein
MVDKQKVFIYLDALRESGVTNMYGAVPYVRKVFDVSQSEGINLLSEWMQTFNQRHPRSE